MRTLRTLLTLIRRQFTDDSPYFAAVAGLAAGCLLVLALLAFVYPQGFLLSGFFVFGVLPIATGTALFSFALAQIHGDRAALALLASISSQPPILLARLITGMVFTGMVVVVLALAMAAGRMNGFLRWPVSLPPDERIDLFGGLFLIGLACYGLGLIAGQRTRTLPGALRAWPLVPVVASLVVVKGTGWPLTLPLLALTAVSLVYLWTAMRHPRFATLAIGLATLVLTLLPLYWLRYALDVALARAMLEASDKASVVCYHEFPLRQSSDPYSEQHFTVRGAVYGPYFPFLRRMGMAKHLQKRGFTDGSIPRWFWGGGWSMRYDAQTGCFVRSSDGNALYAGTEAVAEMCVEGLGRFGSPVVCRVASDEALIFDRQDSRFYLLDFGARRVRGGPKIAENALRDVVDVASAPHLGSCSVGGSYPSAPDRDMLYVADDSGRYVPIVDASGDIAVLDLRTWNLSAGAGRLPAPHTWCGRGSICPRDLSNYSLRVIVKRPEKEYAGLLAASLSRQGASVTVAAFDSEGRRIGEGYSAVPMGPRLATKYLVESLHPPALTLASFFTAYRLDAAATYRTLFLMPNSYVALARDLEARSIFQLLWALLLMAPAMLFSGFLAWRVLRDAAVLGLPWRAKGLWLVGTLALGLPTYITYRLMRPRVVTMPCPNCGHARRVDRDACHCCGGKWDVPPLDPPAWRVVTS